MLLSLISFTLSPFTKSFLEKLQKNKAAQNVLKLYGDSKFTEIRFWDAPFIEVEKLVPQKGKILDLGCGEGIFTNYLGFSSARRKITGIEIDKERIKQADHEVSNVTFSYGDVNKYGIPKVDCIVMFHLLHHLPSFKLQEDLLKKSADSLQRDGKLIIVEVEPEASFKYFLSYFTDHFLVPWIFEKRSYSKVFFRKSKEWRALIESIGFSCTIRSANEGKPFSHVILECQKKS